MDVQWLIAAATQLPFLAIFVWFTLQQRQTEVAEREKRDVEWRAFLDQERTDSRDFLKDERENRQEHMKQGLAAVNSLAGATKEVTDQLVKLRETEKAGQSIAVQMKNNLDSLIECHGDSRAPFSTVRLQAAARLFVQLQHEILPSPISDEAKRLLREMETALS